VGSLTERLAAREQTAAEAVERARAEVEQATARLEQAEAYLARIRDAAVILAEVLAEDEPAASAAASPPAAAPATSGRDGRAWQTVPHRSDDSDLASLPQPYRDVLEVMEDVAEPLRSVDLCRSLGLGVKANATEAMRGKLNRLVERGWCVSPEPGRYALAPGVAGRIG
jgi:hypothetical protein